MRKCVGCQEMKSKKEMMRVLKTSEDTFELDATGKKNGRGAYLCFSKECFEKNGHLYKVVETDLFRNRVSAEFDSIFEQKYDDGIDGKQYDSVALSKHLEKLTVAGRSHLVFVIGGSLGLSKKVLARADEKLSFSALTFPHQMMRVILLEQIYRCFKINRGEKYHW